LQLANKLKLVPDTTTQVALSSFGADSSSFQTLEVTTIQMQTLNGASFSSHSSTYVLPHLFRIPWKLPQLKGLKLANLVSDELEFSISILIGGDHYWSFVQDRIIQGDGPIAPKSRLGCLLSGPLLLPTIQLSTSVLLQITTPAV